MLLSTITGTYYKRGYSEEKMIELVKLAGFDALDFTFCHNAELYDKSLGGEKTTEGYYRKLKALAAENGLVFNQAHAPFASSSLNEDETKRRFDEIVLSIKNASILGAKIIVVHPCQHLVYANDGVPEQLFEINMDFYNRLKPYAEEYGIKIAVENMWQHTKGNNINHSTCSKPAEFIRYMDNLDKTCFTACLDIGHAMLVREDPADFIRALGKDRLGCLHVHDVDGIKDSHTLPFYGTGDWNKICRALKEIGYTGDLTYEAGNFINVLPNDDNVVAEGSKMMAVVGRYLIKQIED